MSAQIHILLILTMVSLCSCRCGSKSTNGDSIVDTTEDHPGNDSSSDIDHDDSRLYDTTTDTWLDADASDSIIDHEDWDSGDCRINFGDGYDISGIGLEVIPRDRPSTYCGPCCEQVSFFRDQLSQPGSFDSFGNYLVYTTRGVHGSTNVTRVVVVDLKSGVEYLIEELLEEDLTDKIYYPAIHEDQLYYSHKFDESAETGICEIRRLSLSSGLLDTVHRWERSASSSTWCSMDLDASASHLVWHDNRIGTSGSQEARFVNTTGGTETTISGHSVSSTSIWDSRIVYTDFSTGPHRVKVYDIETGSLINLIDDTHDTWYPAIWEDIVTWSDARAGGHYSDMSYSDIYLKDIATGIETAVCTHPASQFGSFNSGDLIAWTDLRDDPSSPNLYVDADNWNVYGYWIDRSAESQITDLPGREWLMHVDGNRVFFLMSDTAGVQSIFMTHVSPP